MDKTDFPGILAETALSYRSMIEDGVRRAADGPRKQASPKDLPGLVPILASRMTDATDVFEQLKQLVADRKSEPCPEREAAYFWDVLPYKGLAQYNRKPSKDTKPHDVWMSGNPLQAYQAAEGLVTCPDFLQRVPAEWAEKNIFKREMSHRSRVNHNTQFCEERALFFETYEALLPSGEEMLMANSDFPKHIALVLDSGQQTTRKVASELRHITASLDKKQQQAFETFLRTLNSEQAFRLQALYAPQDVNVDDLPVHIRWKHDLAITCAKYALAGFSRSDVIAQRFRVRMESNAAVIEIPNYMEFDSKRDLTKGVLAMSRKRERPDLEWYPRRVVLNAPAPEVTKTDKQIVAFARGKIRQWQNHEIRTKREVYLSIAEEFGDWIAKATHPDDKVREVHRRLAALGVKLPSSRGRR
ncbi:MAG: hypothetical protein ISS31_08575 [Kiritimatiellae bacterium]|nr:hypothetical protein [Kiritimatiellia bacterium]